MKQTLRSTHLATFVVASVCLTCVVQAGSTGYISTDRFGYAGTITRYATLGDAQSGTNATDVISVSDRDLAVFSSSGLGNDANIIMGSWWYSTAVDGNGDPLGPGHGNTTGNTGVGFMQLFDDDGNTDTNVDMGFKGFDGSNYTEFVLSLTGENAGADDYGRLSAIDNTNDGGTWLNYQMELTASGLAGTADGSGFVTANNHPTDVEGSFTGLFHLTENQTSPDNQGYYVVNFDLNMINWAWENRDDLVGDFQFIDSEFGAFVVPLPPAAFAGLGLLGGLAGVRAIRRR